MRAFSCTSASLPSLPIRRSLINGAHPFKPTNHFPSSSIPISSFPSKLIPASSRFNLFTSSVSLKPLEPDLVNSASAAVVDSASAAVVEKFDWYAQWYPLMPVCDLDKSVPHAKKALGIDVVVWWDQSENAWKVFDDMCPHRLAPLSEGRIDQWGRLQCVYHGWCFDGSGSCKLIPQSPHDGPPVHTNKRACVASYPTIVHHNIVWFWPNTDPQYKDIFEIKKPPFISELDDPSFTAVYGNRDLPYGYEVLLENLMDPSHLPYAHYGLLNSQPLKLKRDKEGGGPYNFTVKELELRGFDAELDNGRGRFDAPCIFSTFVEVPSATNKEHKIKEIGTANWHKSCFVPTKADALVVGFRRWLNKYAGGGVDWRGKYSDDLPPTAPKEQLMDRYSSHVVNCSSCNSAYKGLNALEVILQVASIGLIGIVAATNQGTLSTVARTGLGILAIACFVASRWLAFFVHNNFGYHGYNHALPEKVMFLVRKLSIFS
ncbi:Protochlorophyllide-dependent translocon component 52, chloroplastic [Linum perenne]